MHRGQGLRHIPADGAEEPEKNSWCFWSQSFTLFSETTISKVQWTEKKLSQFPKKMDGNP